ncbi:hypothetical protein QQS21_010195 [Conoideocrella luteorostrata]|uniref:Uncharacterized protein n=1 Tax=Conoideocrella luteorostrata TaxID=1105319 RepID=A0AAJ0FUF4_9HYPO|nr:hypothetical protein QQS21_010195 [Conoideocrella luteorostrata]
MDGFDSRAIASEDLSFIWSAQTNAIVSTFWLVLETFRDVALLQAVREEVQPCIRTTPDGQIDLDTKTLLQQPLLQAMLAENLRLRLHGYLLRFPQRDNIRVNKRIILHNHLCISRSTPASMASEFWCDERAAEHPVDEFWPGRFLKRDAETNKLQFSLAGD